MYLTRTGNRKVHEQGDNVTVYSMKSQCFLHAIRVARIAEHWNYVVSQCNSSHSQVPLFPLISIPSPFHFNFFTETRATSLVRTTLKCNWEGLGQKQTCYNKRHPYSNFLKVCAYRNTVSPTLLWWINYGFVLWQTCPDMFVERYRVRITARIDAILIEAFCGTPKSLQMISAIAAYLQLGRNCLLSNPYLITIRSLE